MCIPLKKVCALQKRKKKQAHKPGGVGHWKCFDYAISYISYLLFISFLMSGFLTDYSRSNLVSKIRNRFVFGVQN